MNCCHDACARMLALNELSRDSHIVLYTSLYKRQPETLSTSPQNLKCSYHQPQHTMLQNRMPTQHA